MKAAMLMDADVNADSTTRLVGLITTSADDDFAISSIQGIY